MKQRIVQDQRRWAVANKALDRLPRRARKRITRLLDCAPVRAGIAHRGEAGRAGSLVRRIGADLLRLHKLLINAEAHGQLHGSPSSDVEQARALVAQAARKSRLVELDPQIRKSWPGRPKAYDWAVLTDAVAEELRATNHARVWPVVADLLDPLIVKAGSPIQRDAQHLRQLVDRWKRDIRRKVQIRKTNETWKRRIVDFRRQAGLR
jgi:hypothetical protein